MCKLPLPDSYETIMDGEEGYFNVTELLATPSYDVHYTSTPSLVTDNTIHHYTTASMPSLVSNYPCYVGHIADDPSAEQESSVGFHNEKEGEIVSDLHKMSPLLRKLEVMSNIITTTCDHNGGVLTSKDGDIKFAVVTACDPSHYQLLTCEDDESYTMRPVDCYLSFKIQGGISWCIFYTDHFYSYCLFRNCQDPMINRISTFF